MQQATTVLLLFGGESAEHDVSIASARNVFAALDDTKFNVKLGYIDKHGKWWLLPSLEMNISVHGYPQLVPALGTGQFMTLPEAQMLKPDVILPVLHGTNGEDGTVQGLAQLLHIPIVGCGVTSSAVCMDKVLTKQLLAQAKIPTVPYVVRYAADKRPAFSELADKLGSPIFVKPSRLGSSVGIHKVTSEEKLVPALEEAHQHDDKVLIEKAISGRELEVAVLGSSKHIEVSGVGEIKPEAEFYSYEAKYDSASQAKVIIPAELEKGKAEKIRDLSRQAFGVLGCKGLARVDFFLAEDGEVFVNEINTLPGFTNISMYPKLWRERGVNYPELVEKLIKIALE